MNELSFRDRELVALGAALASNCVPCIEYHVGESRKAGLSDTEINDALALADKIRQVPARKVLETARQLTAASAPATAGGDACCTPAPATPAGGCTPKPGIGNSCC